MIRADDRTACHPWHHASAVGTQDHIRIEDSDQFLDVSPGGGRQECLNSFSVLGRVGCK